MLPQKIRRKGQCCQLSTYNSLNFSNSVIWPYGEWSLNTSRLPPILRKIRTQFRDLGACPEIWKFQFTEILSLECLMFSQFWKIEGPTAKAGYTLWFLVREGQYENQESCPRKALVVCPKLCLFQFVIAPCIPDKVILQ